MWTDQDLHQFADRLEAKILKAGAHLAADVQATDRVPVFLSRGEEEAYFAFVAREEVWRLWETDAWNSADDWEFVDQLRREDLPAGSFFILLYPRDHDVYLWLLHEPEKKD